jgi:alkyl sulfatase BDS1-like metallo-beta-lactamase superfamily hydrolase
VSEASPQIAARNDAVRLELPFDDDQDFEDARRGRVGSLTDPLIRSTSGRIVWDAAAYDFLEGECPPTVNPSLWRQSRLNAIHGLFEVAEGIFQVRGLDLSNMTIVEGDEGVLVIDPLISCETAAAALALYRAHRGERPVTGLLYTHSHVDHFGGARGVIDASCDIPIVAPEGFLDHAVAENVYAGTAMTRRATYMYGALLEKGPTGGVGAGLGQTTSLGNVSLVPPTVEITHTGQELVVDGIRMEFQMTPGTEAPAEMNFLFPDRRALCVAENATHNLHNVLTLRGALVRDARVWAAYLDEAIDLFGERADVVFAQHHWPCWGQERMAEFLSKQRDLYAYIHDQTLRLLNKGLLASEIAETLELPPGLARSWHCRGYYGSLSHNTKAVYQRYLGWFDGNPAHLWPHPPQAAAERYVALAGGPEALLANARRAFDEGDLRWVVEVVNHLVFAEPQNGEAKELQAQALEQLGFGAENGTWRNFFLMGAKELRDGVAGTATTVPPDMVKGLATRQILDAAAVRLDGMRAAEADLAMHLSLPDTGEQFRLTLSNGVLTHRPGPPSGPVGLAVTITRAGLDDLLTGAATPDALAAAGSLTIEGDQTLLVRLAGLVDPPDPGFPIVTP